MNFDNLHISIKIIMTFLLGGFCGYSFVGLLYLMVTL